MGKVTAKSPLKILSYVFLSIILAVISAFYIINLTIAKAYPYNSSWTTPFSRKALPTDFEGGHELWIDFDDLSAQLTFTPYLDIKDLQIRLILLDKDKKELFKVDKYFGDVRGQLSFDFEIELSDFDNVLDLIKDLKKMDSWTFDVTRGSISSIETIRRLAQEIAIHNKANKEEKE